jgi:hypothetical protein
MIAGPSRLGGDCPLKAERAQVQLRIPMKSAGDSGLMSATHSD